MFDQYSIFFNFLVNRSYVGDGYLRFKILFCKRRIDILRFIIRYWCLDIFHGIVLINNKKDTLTGIFN